MAEVTQYIYSFFQGSVVIHARDIYFKTIIEFQRPLLSCPARNIILTEELHTAVYSKNT